MRAKLYEVAPGVFWLPLRGASVYFVRSGDSWVLVDAGYAGSGRVIEEAAGRLCGATGRPKSILLTHGHPDHAGSATGLAADWDAPVFVTEREKPFVDGTALYPEPLVIWLRQVLPAPCMQALRRGSDLGEAVQAFDPATGVPGLPDWRAVETPGHTPGHVALLRPDDRTLIAGDAVLTMAWWSRLGEGGAGWILDVARGTPRLTGPPAGFTCDWRDAAVSVAALAELEPQVLASGHGTPLGGPDVAPRLRAFAERVKATTVDGSRAR